MAMLRELHEATNERSRLEGAKAVIQARPALIAAFQTVEMPTFEKWLDKTVSEAESNMRQAWAVRESLLVGPTPERTVAEKVVAVAAETAAAAAEAAGSTTH